MVLHHARGVADAPSHEGASDEAPTTFLYRLRLLLWRNLPRAASRRLRAWGLAKRRNLPVLGHLWGKLRNGNEQVFRRLEEKLQEEIL